MSRIESSALRFQTGISILPGIHTKTRATEARRVTELSRATFRGSYQPVKELLNVSDPSIKVSNEISHTTSDIPHATTKVI
jgi:hypothetical protein